MIEGEAFSEARVNVNGSQIYEQISRRPGRGTVNRCGCSHTLFTLRSRLSAYASCSWPSGPEFVPGYHPLAHGRRRMQTLTKEPDIRPSLR